jgi:hypothetical protein
MKIKHLLFLLPLFVACGGGGDVEAAQPPGLRVKPSSIPAPIAGVGTDRTATSVQTPAVGCTDFATQTFCSAFRISCVASHWVYDDPIINQTPGTPNLSHLHMMWGSTSTNYNTDITISPQTSGGGNGSCRGGTINRSRYWMPAVVDTSTGNVMQPENIQVYYKNDGVATNNLNLIPTHLRMIAWNSTASSPQGFRMFQCNSGPGTGELLENMTELMRRCGTGNEMSINIPFGQCLSTTLGVPDVDSPNHKDHVTGAAGGGVCPGTHPYGIPLISLQARYILTASHLSWRLVSDTYTGPAGYSVHTDFRMGWNENMHKRFFFGCLKQGFDCHSNLLGCRDENNNPSTCLDLVD